MDPWWVGPPIEEHRHYLDILMKHDPEAYVMTKELLEKLANIKGLFLNKSMDSISGSLVTQTLHERIKELDMEPYSRGFIFVLIAADTDKFAFRDMFVNWHKAGGRLAAEELCARTQDYLKELNLSADSTEVVVRIYANVKQLEVDLKSNRTMTMGNSLYPFVHGFNQKKALFDFVDVRGGQELVDKKTWESLDLFIDDPKCKHIILGVRHNFGQGSRLIQLFSDVTTRNRVTLLHDGPMNPEIIALGLRRPLKLDSLFK